MDYKKVKGILNSLPTEQKVELLEILLEDEIKKEKSAKQKVDIKKKLGDFKKRLPKIKVEFPDKEDTDWEE